MVLYRGLWVAAQKPVARSSPNAGNFETEFCEEVPEAVGFTLLETRLRVRSQYYPKCHAAKMGIRRTISRIAVANSGHFCCRRTHGPQWLLGIFYRFECPQTQQALAYFEPREFQRGGTSRFVEGVGSRQRTFRGVGGSFVLCLFSSRDFESQSSVWGSAAKFCHSHIFSKVTADCLIVEVPGPVKLPFFSCVLTSLNQPMLKLSPQQ